MKGTQAPSEAAFSFPPSGKRRLVAVFRLLVCAVLLPVSALALGAAQAGPASV
jgi:hypothetical protein